MLERNSTNIRHYNNYIRAYIRAQHGRTHDLKYWDFKNIGTRFDCKG